ncbi:hypothetical protein [Streptomyces sp. NPDC101150]|uniref:hypothetical protein n=1 Tax=Streptomyces sp. NPDC101150 TaxID=3366114 RepID=UPI003811103D
MKSTRRLLCTLGLVALLGTGVTACGPEDAPGGDAADPGASAQPSQSAQQSVSTRRSPDPARGDDSSRAPGSGDCGRPPKLPAGHKMIEIATPPKQDSMTAKDAEPSCTPNDWIYHGQGAAKYYLFSPGEVKAEVSTGPGSFTSVVVGELWNHVSDCMTDMSAVKAPYTCSGNIYDITLDGEGKVKTIKEIWHP